MSKKVDLTDMSLNMLSEGMFGKVIESELMRITADLEQRGSDEKSRKLAIVLDFAYDNTLRRYVIKPSCQAKLPPQAAYPTQAKLEFDPVKKGYVFEFNPDSVIPDQSTVNDVLEKQ